MIKLILFILLFFQVSLARSVDPDGATHFFPELDIRYLKKLGDFRLISEFRYRSSFDNRHYSHIKLGFNYRLLPFLKLGIHYRGQNNNRNFDDWRKAGTRWFWNEEANGFENVVSPQIMFRQMLSPVIRAELRLQNDFNLKFGYQTLRVRPNLTYFLLDGGEHVANVYMQYESFLPLNYGDVNVAQRWIYLGSLFPLENGHKWGVSVAFAEWRWSPSVMFQEALPTENYLISDKAYILAVTYLFSH